MLHTRAAAPEPDLMVYVQPRSRLERRPYLVTATVVARIQPNRAIGDMTQRVDAHMTLKRKSDHVKAG